MRQHVGFHILNEDIESSQNVCGFCGSADSCDISICRGSGRGKTASEIPQSTCSYFEKFSLKSAAKSTKTSPCTNRPIECATCKRIFWSYNMHKYSESNHSDFDRQKWMVTDEEKCLIIQE